MPASSVLYFDHNATTPIHPAVTEEMARVSTVAWANPGSRHREGRRARQVLEDARERLAALLGASPQQVVWTSGGTEANNLAILGLARSERRVAAILPGEHPSLENPVVLLTRRGWMRQDLPIDSDGQLRNDAAESIDWERMGLVTIALAHSETGVIRDIGPLVERCRHHGVPLHVDAVQAAGKRPLDFHRLGATSLSLAAHKFGGPRGVGAIVVSETLPIDPLLRGGLQERERRPGTEPVVLAAGMVRALELWTAERETRTAHLRQLRDRFEAGLRETCAPIVIHGERTTRLANTSNIAFPGCDGEALLVSLDLAGICASLGTACSSGATEPAPILVAMGCPPEVLRSSVRFSFGPDQTLGEIEQGIGIVSQVVKRNRAQ